VNTLIEDKMPNIVKKS